MTCPNILRGDRDDAFALFCEHEELDPNDPESWDDFWIEVEAQVDDQRDQARAAWYDN